MIRVNKLFIILAITLLILTILVPLITYSYLTNTYNANINSSRNKEKNLQQQVDSLTAQNKQLNEQLNEENSQLTNLTQPFLETRLGWYLHNSFDPVSSSRDTLLSMEQYTILGICQLIIRN